MFEWIKIFQNKMLKCLYEKQYLFQVFAPNLNKRVTIHLVLDDT